MAQKRLSYLDYVLTHRLLRHYADVGQEVALFICHLILAAKEGHLCLRICFGELAPSVNHLWQNEESQLLTDEEVRALTLLIFEGAQKIPSGLLTSNCSDDVAPHTPICREGNDFYLQRHWIFETLFLKSLKRHLKTAPALILNPQSVKKTVENLYRENFLLQAQTEAVLQGCLNPLTLISGGPGTGKTYTVGYLIKVFWEHLSKEQKQSCQIVLAAPTGKAAANLQRSLEKVSATLDDFPSIQAKTLHALLGVKPEGYYKNSRLGADLIIVDESSMIDIKMMAYLFDALKLGSRLILLGDQHQLPSIEAGSVFVDLIQLQRSFACSHSLHSSHYMYASPISIIG